MTVPRDVIRFLVISRRREKAQTVFYRKLASMAESQGDEAVTERLNELHADEQHHLSRISARLLELGETLEEVEARGGEHVPLSEWERVARMREEEEIVWYGGWLDRILDPDTRSIIAEILDSEKHHARELGGKWMLA